MAKVLSTILVLFLAPAFFFLVFVFSIKMTVSSQFIKKELAVHDAYTKIQTNILEVVNSFEKSQSQDGQATIVNNEEIAATIQKTITPTILKQATEGAIDSMGSAKASSENSSLKNLKTQISSAVTNSLRAKYETLPYCSDPSEAADMTCRPPGVTFETAMTQIASVSGQPNPLQALNNIPDNLNTSEAAKKSGPFSKVSSTIRPILNYFYIYSAILLVILILLGRLFAGSWKKAPQGLGIFLAILGFTSFVFGFIVSKFGFSAILNLLSKYIPGLTVLKKELIIPVFKDILTNIAGEMSKVSISVFVVGLVLFLLFFILSKIKKTTGEANRQ